MTKKEIQSKAREIAGALWEDVYDAPDKGTLADCLLWCSQHRNEGTDGDLNDGDRAALRALSKEARKL